MKYFRAAIEMGYIPVITQVKLYLSEIRPKLSGALKQHGNVNRKISLKQAGTVKKNASQRMMHYMEWSSIAKPFTVIKIVKFQKHLYLPERIAGTRKPDNLYA